MVFCFDLLASLASFVVLLDGDEFFVLLDGDLDIDELFVLLAGNLDGDELFVLLAGNGFNGDDMTLIIC